MSSEMRRDTARGSGRSDASSSGGDPLRGGGFDQIAPIAATVWLRLLGWVPATRPTPPRPSQPVPIMCCSSNSDSPLSRENTAGCRCQPHYPRLGARLAACCHGLPVLIRAIADHAMQRRRPAHVEELGQHGVASLSFEQTRIVGRMCVVLGGPGCEGRPGRPVFQRPFGTDRRSLRRCRHGGMFASCRPRLLVASVGAGLGPGFAAGEREPDNRALDHAELREERAAVVGQFVALA